MQKLFVAFGEELCRLIDNGAWDEVAKMEDGVIEKKVFKTKAEKNAYIQGIEDAIGWAESWYLSSEELAELSKHIDIEKL